MVGNQWEYHLRDAGNAGSACPTGFTCNRNVRSEALAAWRAEQGATIDQQFDNVFYVMAGHDESSTWQEWGEMMFQTMDDVTDPWGNPDPTKPNWAPTRYVPWSSFLAAQNIWPSAGGNSSTEAESSGMGVFAHELSHNLGIGDNYNNPYGIPLRRSYTGPWDMLSRGSFNGPGGPHSRWMIPAVNGASLGSNHNIRNRLKLGFLNEANLLRLDSAALAASGVVVADVTARAVDPGPTGLTGVNVNLAGGDQTPPCVVATTADCPATAQEQNSQRYNNYTLEVVQRVGNDSFTPGHGVLLSRTKNGPSDRAPFVWVIDAHPEDIDVVDFRRPNGDEAMYSYGDYRQLADATFNAGLRSGTEYEYVDQANRLHFYVVDKHENAAGVLGYTVAVKSLDGSGPQPRGTKLGTPTTSRVTPAWAAHCNFPLTNTGGAGPIAGTHPEDVGAYLGSDVYRLSASLEGDGWTADLYNALATAHAGETVNVPVYVTRTPGADNRAVVTLTATSESDPTKTATSTCKLKVSDLNH
jgi:M6 family metalloprotease-like protein